MAKGNRAGGRSAGTVLPQIPERAPVVLANNVAVEIQAADSGPDLLTHWQTLPESRVFLRDGIGSIVVHVVLIVLVFLLESIPETPRLPPVIRVDVSQAVPLIAPPLRQLTQKEPNTGAVAKEVNVEGLMAQRGAPATMPSRPREFRAPASSAPAPPRPNEPQLVPEPPKIQAEAHVPPNLLPQFGSSQVPPPKTQSENPQLPMQTPGQNGIGVARAPGRMTKVPPPPQATVQNAINSAIHGQGQGGNIEVGDEDQPPSIADQLHEPTAQPRRIQSSLQLLSDPQGVDFKPYMIRILATVRRNWMAIIPESARMGRRGRVLLQFIVDRDGSVPKLVIAMPSGAEALDRAAVAGISASVPFPPLPPEFKGHDIRLQFAFTYNMQ